MSEGRPATQAATEGFEKCLRALRETHEALFFEAGPEHAIFDALRVYMTVAALHLSRMEGGDDAAMREVLHGILDTGISDYQFNQRLHVGSREGS